MTLLPANIEYGHVQGRWLLAVADTQADPDSLPDPQPATGTVVFTPFSPQRESDEPTPTTIFIQSVTVSLVDGELSHSSQIGVDLVTGLWAVTFKIDGGSLPSLLVEVTTEHTRAAPLYLNRAAPAVPVEASHVIPSWVPLVVAAADRAEAARDAAIAAAESVGDGGGGSAGASAYEVAVANGFVGTEAEWLTSLAGAPGASAYEVAVANGFVGTELEWLASLEGADGGGGTGGSGLVVSDTAPTDTTAVWVDTSEA